jgi:cell division septation protein DedD
MHGGGWSPETKRRLIIACVIIVSLGIATAIASFLGTPDRNRSVPVVEADPRPIRVTPANPGGMQLSSILPEELENADGRVEPEMPDAAALKTYSPPIPIETKITPRARTYRQAEAHEPPSTQPTGRLATNLAPMPPQPSPPKPTSVTTGSGAQASASAAKPTTEPQARVGKAAVQLAALQSETAARSEWESLRRRLPDLLGARQPSFPKTERDGRVFWRVRTGGFADMAEARGFCEKLRARGAACTASDS